MKEVTPFIRQCIYMWIAGNNLEEFTVWEVQRGVESAHKALEELKDLDLSKAVSNELQRLERWHKLGSRKGIKGEGGCGLGRPPRVFYRKIIFKKA